MRVWYSGIMPSFQVGDTSSILVTRSKSARKKRTMTIADAVRFMHDHPLAIPELVIVQRIIVSGRYVLDKDETDPRLIQSLESKGFIISNDVADKDLIIISV